MLKLSCLNSCRKLKVCCTEVVPVLMWAPVRKVISKAKFNFLYDMGVKKLRSTPSIDLSFRVNRSMNCLFELL